MVEDWIIEVRKIYKNLGLDIKSKIKGNNCIISVHNSKPLLEYAFIIKNNYETTISSIYNRLLNNLILNNKNIIC